jgi:hypothetical protein
MGLSIGALIKHLYTSRVIDDRRKNMLQAQLYTRHNPETGTTFGKYEPGWKDRTPELPGMLRYWLERTVRTSQPKAVAAPMGIWSADLLSQLLDGQALPGGRPVDPSSSPATSRDPRVVSLRAHPECPDTSAFRRHGGVAATSRRKEIRDGIVIPERAGPVKLCRPTAG